MTTINEITESYRNLIETMNACHRDERDITDKLTARLHIHAIATRDVELIDMLRDFLQKDVEIGQRYSEILKLLAMHDVS